MLVPYFTGDLLNDLCISVLNRREIIWEQAKEDLETILETFYFQKYKSAAQSNSRTDD